MALFSNILFPIDLSDNNLPVARFVTGMAQAHGANVHVLHVVGDLENLIAFYVPHPSFDNLSVEMVESSRRLLRAFVEANLGQAPEVTTAVVVGDPAQTIVSYAAEQRMDLIIMGTHGRQGLEHAVFGSVTEKVVKKSMVPVLVINPYQVK